MEAVIRCSIDYLLEKSGVVIPKGSKMFLSHHHGIEHFAKYGAAVIECFNMEDYAKKVLVMLPGQYHHQHYHNKKHETFHVLYGDLCLVEAETFTYHMGPGDLRVITPGQKHSFSTDKGCVFEEISTHQHEGDSVYEMALSEDRKTLVREF